MSANFTRCERRVLEAVDRRGEATTAAIIDSAWENGRGNTYDQTHYALRELVDAGVLARVRRGVYRRTEGRQ